MDSLKEEDAKSLALHQPQVERAKAQLEAAKSGLKRALLALKRTTIRAPFDVIVQQEMAEVGQVVSPQTPLANLVGTKAFWVQVAVPVGHLKHIDIPGYGAKKGSSVLVRQSLGDGAAIEKEGQISRLVGELDPLGHMAQLLVEISSPLKGKHLPLLPGAKVSVFISGKTLTNVYRVPRSALKEGSFVWIIDGESKLEKRPVQIAWRQPHHIWVNNGLNPQDKIVSGSIPAPVEGMNVRPANPPKRLVTEDIIPIDNLPAGDEP